MGIFALYLLHKAAISWKTVSVLNGSDHFCTSKISILSTSPALIWFSAEGADPGTSEVWWNQGNQGESKSRELIMLPEYRGIFESGLDMARQSKTR